jgi:2-polyprenyl-3-methyl-5-hydroxy-6-metoxy-1,4-benzoquinol methylase
MSKNIILDYFCNGEVEKAISMAKGYGFVEMVINFEKSLQHTNSKEQYKKYYEECFDNGTAWHQIVSEIGPDLRQRMAMIHLKELKIDSLLDIGCADGSFIFFCLKNGIIKKATGVDPWINGIKWATQYSTDNFPNQAIFKQGLIEDILIDSNYDAIHIGEVLEHVIDPVGVLEKIKQCRPKGIVVTVPIERPPLTLEEKTRLSGGSVTTEHIRLITLEVLARYCSESGMVISKMEIVGSKWVNLVATLKIRI